MAELHAGRLQFAIHLNVNYRRHSRHERISGGQVKELRKHVAILEAEIAKLTTMPKSDDLLVVVLLVLCDYKAIERIVQ